MSEYPPGTFLLAERSMDMAVRDAHQWAETERLRREAAEGRSRLQRFYFDLLAALGHRLAVWGERLLERYDAEGSTQATQTV